MNIKVLPLQRWMEFTGYVPEHSTLQAYLARGDLIEIPPRFNRHGWYKYGNLVWFESEAGAFLTPKYNDQFDYELMCLEFTPLRQCVKDAISLLSREHLDSKDQLRMLRGDGSYRGSRSSQRDFMRRLNKFKRSCNANSAL